MNRVKASNNGTRIGSVLYNPGGPGGIATAQCEAQALGYPVFGDVVPAHFDIICPDPRGVGTSSSVLCDPDLWNQRPSLYPKDKASFDALVEHNKAFGQSCLDKSGELFKHVDTISVVRDLEAIRVALGEGKLNFLGISYGTQIGSQYAELFPDNIRTMVLDGITDHTTSEVYSTAGESGTYEDVLNLFFDWCHKNETCALHGEDVAKIFDDLVTQADIKPIPAPDCAANVTKSPCFPNVTGEDIIFNTELSGFLTFTEDNLSELAENWKKLGDALDNARKGNATALSSPMATDENSTAWQGLAVGCLDWRHDTATFEDNIYRRYLANATTPHSRGASLSYQLGVQCIGWPAPLQNPPRLLDQKALKRAPPILMVNALHDPETSYLWTANVRAQIPSSVLLTRRGAGHSSWPLGGEATALMEAYFLNKTLPAQNTVVDS